MTARNNHQPAEHPGEPPQGWTPRDDDGDARWRGVERLMRAADDPDVPARRRFEEIRDAAWAEVHGTHRHHTGFGAWLREVLVGGGIGGQVVRLVPLALLAAFAGYSLAPRETPSPAPQGGGAVVAEATPPAAARQLSPDIIQPVGANGLSANELTAWLASSPISEAAMRASGWGLATGAQEPSQPGAIGVIDASALAGWQLPGERAAAQAPAREVLALLRQLKLQSLMESNGAALQSIRQLEDALVETMVPSVGEDTQAAAMDAYREGERFLAQGEHARAVEAFRRATAAGNSPSLALLAQIQIAEALYGPLEDYAGALEAYRSILEDFPSEAMLPRHREKALERYEMLARNGDNAWEAVRLWRRAETARTERERGESLLEVLRTSPGQPVAGRAALEVARMTFSNPAAELDPGAVVAVLDFAANSGVPHAGAFQYAKALVIHRRLLLCNYAADQYLKVLELPGGEEFRESVYNRLGELDCEG